MLLGVVVLLSTPFQSGSSVVFATHTDSAITPTPTLSSQYQGANGSAQQNPWVGQPTSTPTPFGYNPYQPAQNQTQYPGTPPPTYSGVPGQTYPPGLPGQQTGIPGQQTGMPGQQSVPSPPYVGAPGANPGSSTGALPGAIVPSSASPAPGGSDPCYGDEVITFSPESPRIGNELLIAVTSSRPHPYGRLAGTEKTTFVRERPGQRGYVWEWTIQPSYPGQHEYTFYVDSTVPCQKVEVRVLQSLATRTPTPTKTATPWGWDNGNGNSNSNSNSNDNTFSDPNFGYNYGGYYNFGTTPTPSVFDPRNYLGQGDRYGCADFASHADAQAVLRADPNDPNRLDANPRDGLACGGLEASQDGVGGGFMPPPGDGTLVPRP